MQYLNVYYIYSEKEVQTYHLLNHSQTVNNLFFFGKLSSNSLATAKSY